MRLLSPNPQVSAANRLCVILNMQNVTRKCNIVRENFSRGGNSSCRSTRCEACFRNNKLCCAWRCPVELRIGSLELSLEKQGRVRSSLFCTQKRHVHKSLSKILFWRIGKCTLGNLWRISSLSFILH